MKIKVVASSCGSSAPYFFSSSFIVNDTLGIDAGSLGFFSPLSEQRAIRHLLLSHSHSDHVATLPIFVENVFKSHATPVTIHAGAATLDSVRRDLFNDRVWPDFLRMNSPATPFLEIREIQAEKTIELEGLRITPIPVHHVVPTFGFVIEDDTTAVVFSNDTGPTDQLWEHANRLPHLKAVFLEASFPNAMHQLAVVSQHLTPKLFEDELRKLNRPVPVYAIHLKAWVFDDLTRELLALGRPNIHLATPGQVYHF